MKHHTPISAAIFLCLLSLLVFSNCVHAQVVRLWDYSYNPSNNYEASGNCIVALPSGTTVTGGIFRGVSNFVTRNTLLLTDASGALLEMDSLTQGSGFKKVIYDGHSDIYACATLYDDSLPVSKIVVARFDTSFTIRRFFLHDTTNTSTGYDVLDMATLSNGNIVIASRWDEFPLVCLSLLCMDSTGNVLWERVDSVFQFSYDVKLLSDPAGGLFVAGSGKDTSTSEDFIFVSHFTDFGTRDWTYRYYSPAQFYADMTDMIQDLNGYVYVSGNVMDSIGQVGVLLKFDSFGNLIRNQQVLPLAYSRIISDSQGDVYGLTVPLNGLDVFTIDKRDSSGTLIDSSAFQLSGYFASELGDVKLLDNGIIVVTGGLFVFSFPKSDMFLAAMDTSLNLIGYDIFDSLNQLGENGKAIATGVDGSVYACGRFNFENQFETCNIGVTRYLVEEIINSIATPLGMRCEVYPNPSKGIITVKWNVEQYGKAKLKIFNNHGVEVFSDHVLDTGLKEFRELNLSPGFYFVSIETSMGRTIKKFCVL